MSRWTGKSQPGYLLKFPGPQRTKLAPLPVTHIHTNTHTDAHQVSRWTGKSQPGYLHKFLPLANGDGASLEVEVEFLP